MRRLRLLVFAVITLVGLLGLAPTAALAATYQRACYSTGYACDPTGYAGQATWGFAGPHNCTTYAAWRQARNGVPYPGYNLGNAATWAERARAHGVRVDRTPAVGAVAQWNAYTAHAPHQFGHVGYVQQVGPGYIVVVSDNFPVTDVGHMDTYRIPVGHPHWPSNFIHFRDVSNVAFVKTRNTGSSRVELHTATAASGYQQGTHAATWFSTADQSNGWFSVTDADGDGRPDVAFVKTRNTGSGRVELHTATAASGYQQGTHAATWFSTADQSNGWFSVVNGSLDVAFVKTPNTGSVLAELHTATTASGYQSGTHAATWFSTADQSNGWFSVPDMG